MKINEITSSDNFKSNLLTSPNNTLIIDTPGDLDWYKLGQQFPNLDKANPAEFGQGDSDMQVTLANPTELAQLKSTLNKLGIKWKDVGGTNQHGEIHTEEVEVSLHGIVKEESITEALDNPYPFNLKGPSDSQEFVATANTPNGPLRMDFETVDYDNFGIDFSVGKSMGKTEAGDEFRVFATVVAMMSEWIKTVGIEHVESFDFGANKDEHASDGRARLYTRFAKRLASQLGWKLEQSTTRNRSTAFFKLTNPKPVTREQEYWDAIEESKLGPNGEIPAYYSESVAEAEDTLTLPKIKVGDEVMVGKFKNRKAEVKGFGKDDHNQPVLKTTKGDQKLFKPRLSKLMRNL